MKKKNINQLKTGVLLSYMTMGLNMLIQLIYTPIMIRFLGQSEYGLYTLVGSFISYLSLFSLGFTGAYLRFYSRFKIENNVWEIYKLNGLFLLMFLLMSVTSIVTGMILSFFPREILGSNLTRLELEKAQLLMRILVINIALTFPSSLFEAIVSACEQFLFQRLINMLAVVFNPLICLPLLFFGKGSVAVVTVTTLITVAKLLINIFYVIEKLETRFFISKINWKLLNEIAGFSFFIFLNMIIDQVNWSVDKFILGRVSGTGSVAIYGVGAQINSLYTAFSTAISSVYSPRVNRIAVIEKKEAGRRFTELFIRVGKLQYLVLGLIVTGFMFFGEFFITAIYLTQEYYEAYYVALLLIFPATIPLIQNLGIEIQRSVNKHKFRSLVYFVMAIANIGISIPLAKLYGPVGCAIGTAITLLTANGIIMNIYYQKRLDINVMEFWKNIFSESKGLVLPILLGIWMVLKKPYNSLTEYFICIVIYIIVYSISMWFVGMNEQDKILILENRIVKSIKRNNKEDEKI